MTFLIKHFDTIDSYYEKTPLNNSVFNFQYPIKNIKKIYLKNIQLSIDWTNIRENLNEFKIVYNNVIYTQTLTTKNYTSITQLINDLNGKFLNVLPNNIIVLFSLNTINNCIDLKLTGSTPLTFSIFNTNFSDYILGFKFSSSNQTGNNYTISALNQYLLNSDNYIIMNLINISGDNNNVSQKLCNFKIPLNASNSMVYFDNEFSNLSQFIYNTDKSLILNSLKIQIIDRFNNVFNNYNNDFSFTLGFDIE